MERTNAGYVITDSVTVGNSEIVIGENLKAPDPFVCWYCKNGTDYFWGHYTNELDAAREKLNERYQTERRLQRNAPAPKQQSGDDRER